MKKKKRGEGGVGREENERQSELRTVCVCEKVRVNVKKEMNRGESKQRRWTEKKSSVRVSNRQETTEK
jgi:hypothetical protein